MHQSDLTSRSIYYTPDELDNTAWHMRLDRSNPLHAYLQQYQA
jgi:hypothetical protein